jgi:hypothetical protein
MAITNVLFDTAAPAGSKLDPAVAAEVAEVAPGNLEPEEVQALHLAPEAVEREKIKLGAVDSPQIAEGGVKAINIDAGAVGTSELAADSVTAEKAGTGVTTAYDAAGNPVEDKTVYLTATQYALLAPPDPNTTYYIS